MVHVYHWFARFYVGERERDREREPSSEPCKSDLSSSFKGFWMDGSPLWNVSSVFGALMMTKYAIRYTATAGRVRRNAYLIKYIQED